MQLSSGAQRLLRILKSLARLSGRAFPFQRTLRLMAAKTGPLRTVRTIQRWLAELVRAGLVIVKKRQHSSAEYQLQDVVSNVVSKQQECRVCAPDPITELKTEWGGAAYAEKQAEPETYHPALGEIAGSRRGIPWAECLRMAAEALA